MKSNKLSKLPSLQCIQVGNNAYTGNMIPDGFFHSLKTLKSKDNSGNPILAEADVIFRHALELAKEGAPIPEVSLHDAESILKSLKPNVSDLFSIPPCITSRLVQQE